MNKIKNIFVDFDCVLYNTDKAIWDLYNQIIVYPKPIKKWNEIQKWDYSDTFDFYGRQEILNQLFKNERLYVKENLNIDLINLLKEYHSKGINIIICTICNAENAINKISLLKDEVDFATIMPIINKDIFAVNKKIANMNNSIFLDDSLKILLSTNADHKILVELNNHKKTDLICPKDIKTTKSTEDIKNEIDKILGLSKNVVK